jgi:hypothetical protein
MYRVVRCINCPGLQMRTEMQTNVVHTLDQDFIILFLPSKRLMLRSLVPSFCLYGRRNNASLILHTAFLLLSKDKVFVEHNIEAWI